MAALAVARYRRPTRPDGEAGTLNYRGSRPTSTVVDEGLRRERASRAGTGSETGTAVNLAPLHMTVSTPRMAISLGVPNVRA